jgi:bloom syndrome protein
MRNNLDDVLRKNKSSTTPTVPLISSPKQKVNYIPQVWLFLNNVQPFKFKPAVAAHGSTTNGGVSQAVKVSSANLPSFSTPGFGKFRPNTTQGDAAPRTREVVSISSDSNPSSPRSIKRTSSDPSFTSDASPQSSKRLKRECLADKENLFQPILLTKSMGKAKPPLDASHAKPTECSDDEPWRKINSDPERNPWAKLDRDFPSHSIPGPCPKGLVIPDCDSDLLSVCNRCCDLALAAYASSTERL